MKKSSIYKIYCYTTGFEVFVENKPTKAFLNTLLKRWDLELTENDFDIFEITRIKVEKQ